MQLRIQFEWLLMSIHFSTYFLFLLIIWWFLSSRTGEVTSPVWTLLHLTLCQLQVRHTVVSTASADIQYEIWCPLLSAVHWSWKTEGNGLKYYNVFWRYLCFILTSVGWISFLCFICSPWAETSRHQGSGSSGRLYNG